MSDDARVEGVVPARWDGRVIVATRYESDFEEAMFDPDYWLRRDAVVDTTGGRGQVLYIDRGDEQWVLRHYHRGGMISAALADRYVWAGAARTRSMREFRLLAELSNEGLPVPRPVAARFVRDGRFYRGDLLTVRLAAARSLASIAVRAVPPDPIWRAVGVCIRRLHDAGVFHADLNAHNIVIDSAGRIFVVDFDRGRRRRPGPWQRANLRRLNRSLHKIGVSLAAPDFEQQQWRILIDGYESG